MLRQDIKQYIDHHRAMGFKYRVQSYLLYNFATFAEKQNDQFVRCQTVLEWTGHAPSAAQRRNRLLTVRRFAIVMQAEDKRYQIPPAGAFGNNSFKRSIRHIFSPHEIKSLLIASKKLSPEKSIRPVTYSTLFALLAATGLRISEALALSYKDFTSEGLIIHATKFRKDRLVPLHRSSQKGLELYLNIRSGIQTIDEALFISLYGTRLSYSRVNQTFLELIRSIGLRDTKAKKGLCINDLRHTFAVRSLEQCVGNSEDIAHHMVALSTYLGHAHISDTYWYLQATPKLMKQIAVVGEKLYRREQ